MTKAILLFFGTASRRYRRRVAIELAVLSALFAGVAYKCSVAWVPLPLMGVAAAVVLFMFPLGTTAQKAIRFLGCLVAISAWCIGVYVALSRLYLSAQGQRIDPIDPRTEYAVFIIALYYGSVKVGEHIIRFQKYVARHERRQAQLQATSARLMDDFAETYKKLRD